MTPAILIGRLLPTGQVTKFQRFQGLMAFYILVISLGAGKDL